MAGKIGLKLIFFLKYQKYRNHYGPFIHAFNVFYMTNISVYLKTSGWHGGLPIIQFVHSTKPLQFYGHMLMWRYIKINYCFLLGTRLQGTDTRTLKIIWIGPQKSLIIYPSYPPSAHALKAVSYVIAELPVSEEEMNAILAFQKANFIQIIFFSFEIILIK